MKKPYQDAIDALNNLIASESTILNCVTLQANQCEKGVDVKENRACHAGLVKCIYQMGKPLFVVSRVMNDIGRVKLTHREKLVYTDYLINRSPLEEVFYEKDAEEVLSTQYFIANCDVPSNKLAAGLISTRYLSETTRIARAFVKIVDAGVDEDIAYILAHMFKFSSDGKVSKHFNGDAHVAFTVSYWSWKGVGQWINHSPVGLNESYADNHYYRGIEPMFNRSSGTSGFYKLIKDWSFKKASAGTANPFSKSVKKSSVEYFDESDFLREVKSLEEEVDKNAKR